MADVVVQLPVTSSEDAAFGHYLNRFMESRSLDVEQQAISSDAPFIMIRSDPAVGDEVKIIIFQEPGVASAFSSGWANARRRSFAPV